MASNATNTRHILIGGGGPCGAVTAYFLAKAGFKVTVAERSSSSSTYGQGIDITGPAIEIVQRMGAFEAIKAKTTNEGGFTILDDDSKPFATLGTSEHSGKGLTLTQEIEILRGDLTKILRQCAESEGVEFRYRCAIEEIRESEAQVTAVLSDSGEAEQFTAIIGADGLLSSVRKLAFRFESTEKCFAGQDQYTAYYSIKPQSEDSPNSRLQHATGGRVVLIRPVSNERSSCYLVRTGSSPALAAALGQSAEEQKAIFARDFAGFTGTVGQRAIKGMWEAKDFYCAQTAQIRLPVWSQGRVALCGDAAYCPSPVVGKGTVLAILGAYILAGEMARSPDDPIAAFQMYERSFRPYVERAQSVPLLGTVMKLANPQSQLAIVILRSMFWFIAWSGVWRPFNPQRDAGFELPEYHFDGCSVRVGV